MDEQRFWEIMEKAWSRCEPEVELSRRNLLSGSFSDKDAKNLSEAIDELVVIVFEDQVDYLDAKGLIEFDRILERKLFEIDRKEIHTQHGGPIERFLFARSFIVLAGKDYYDAVNADPNRVVPKMESEEMSESARLYYFHKYDEEMPGTDISRKTGSNKAGWNGVS